MRTGRYLGVLATVIAAIFYLRAAIVAIMSVLEGHYLALSYGVFCSYIFVLFLIRHPAKASSTRIRHWIFAVSGTLLPYVLRPVYDVPGYVYWIGYPLMALGMGFSLVALVTLGRSFGIIAARREIVTRGIYRLIRHPLYAGEAVWFLSIIVTNVSAYNVVLFCLHTACQIRRLLEEEVVLRADPSYVAYVNRVRYRLIPGIY